MATATEFDFMSLDHGLDYLGMNFKNPVVSIELNAEDWQSLREALAGHVDPVVVDGRSTISYRGVVFVREPNSA